ncbi:hypothetical protein ACHAXS_011908 [Conticribra weissflogii]
MNDRSAIHDNRQEDQRQEQPQRGDAKQHGHDDCRNSCSDSRPSGDGDKSSDFPAASREDKDTQGSSAIRGPSRSTGQVDSSGSGLDARSGGNRTSSAGSSGGSRAPSRNTSKSDSTPGLESSNNSKAVKRRTKTPSGNKNDSTITTGKESSKSKSKSKGGKNKPSEKEVRNSQNVHISSHSQTSPKSPNSPNNFPNASSLAANNNNYGNSTAASSYQPKAQNQRHNRSQSFSSPQEYHNSVHIPRLKETYRSIYIQQARQLQQFQNARQYREQQAFLERVQGPRSGTSWRRQMSNMMTIERNYFLQRRQLQNSQPMPNGQLHRSSSHEDYPSTNFGVMERRNNDENYHPSDMPGADRRMQMQKMSMQMQNQGPMSYKDRDRDQVMMLSPGSASHNDRRRSMHDNLPPGFNFSRTRDSYDMRGSMREGYSMRSSMRNSLRDSIRDINDMREFSNMRDGVESMSNRMNPMWSRDDMRDMNGMGPRGMTPREDQMMNKMNIMMMQDMDNMNMGMSMGMNTNATAMSPRGRMGMPPMSPRGRLARMQMNEGLLSHPMDPDRSMDRGMHDSFKRMRGLSDVDVMTPIEQDGLRQSLGRNHSMMASTSGGSNDGKGKFSDGNPDLMRKGGMENGGRRFTNSDLNNFIGSPKSNASMSDFLTFPSPSPFGMSRPTFTQFMASRQRHGGMMNPMDEGTLGLGGDSMMDKSVMSNMMMRSSFSSRGNNFEPFTPNDSMRPPFSPGMRRGERMSLSPGKLTGMEQFMADSSMGRMVGMGRVGGVDRIDGISNTRGVNPTKSDFSHNKEMMARHINDRVSDEMNMSTGNAFGAKEKPGMNRENDISMMPPPPFSSERDISKVPPPPFQNPVKQSQSLHDDKDRDNESNKRNRAQMEEPPHENTYDRDEPPPPSLLHAKIRRKNSSGANGMPQRGASSSNPFNQKLMSPRSPTPKKGLLERQRIMEDEMKTHMAEAYGVLQKKFGNVYPVVKNGQDDKISSPHEGAGGCDANTGDNSGTTASPTLKPLDHTGGKGQEKDDDNLSIKELKSPATDKRPAVGVGFTSSQDENIVKLTKKVSTGSASKSNKVEDTALNSTTTIKTKKSSTKITRKDSGVKSTKSKKGNSDHHADGANSSSVPRAELSVDIQKPRRPFSAYNLYFQLEREWITQNIALGKTTADLNREDGILEVENGELRAIPKETSEHWGGNKEDKNTPDQTSREEESGSGIPSEKVDAAVTGDVNASAGTPDSKMRATSGEIKEAADGADKNASDEDSKEAEAILLSLNPTKTMPDVVKKSDGTDSKKQDEPNAMSRNDSPKAISEVEVVHDLNDDPTGDKPSSDETKENCDNKPKKNLDDNQFCDPEMPERYRKLKLEKNWFRAGHKAKRKHRKTEGTVGFIEMTRMISSRWSVVDEEIRKYCQKLADGELQEYRLEMQKYKTMMDQAQREARLAAKFKSDLEKERKKSTAKTTSKKSKKEKELKPAVTANGSGDEPTPVTDQSKKSMLDSDDHAMFTDSAMFHQNQDSAALSRSDPQDNFPQAKKAGGLPGLPPPPFSEARQLHDFGRKYGSFTDAETRHRIMQQRMREMQCGGMSFGEIDDKLIYDGHRSYGARFADGNMHSNMMGRMDRFADGREMPPIEREELLAMRNMMLSNRMAQRDSGYMMTGGGGFPNRMMGTFDYAPNMQNRSEQEFDVEVDRFLNCLGKEVSETNRRGSAGDGDSKQVTGMRNGAMTMRRMDMNFDENMGMRNGPMISNADMNRRSYRQDLFSRHRDDEPALPEYEWGNR